MAEGVRLDDTLQWECTVRALSLEPHVSPHQLQDTLCVCNKFNHKTWKQAMVPLSASHMISSWLIAGKKVWLQQLIEETPNGVSKDKFFRDKRLFNENVGWVRDFLPKFSWTCYFGYGFAHWYATLKISIQKEEEKALLKHIVKAGFFPTLWI